MVAVVELVKLVEFKNQDAKSFRVTVPPSGPKRAALAQLIATGLARALCAPDDEAFIAWQERAAGGPAHTNTMKKVLRAYLMQDFKTAADKTRVQGAVVEQLWAVLAPVIEGGWGCPAYVEAGHSSVIDHGGDGLSLYAFDSNPDLRFRVWESKRHAGKTTITSTITRAAKQLQSRGDEYVARLSKPLQNHEDGRVRALAAAMTKLWVARDGRAAVGVSVGKASGEAIPKRPFQGLKKEFNFNEMERREGVVIEIDDLDGFATSVRTRLLRGIN